MGKKDKKKTRDPEKKAALAAKKDAKADKAAIKRMEREKDRLSSLSLHDDDYDGAAGGNNNSSSSKNNKAGGGEENIDSILESFRQRTQELTSAELEVIEDPPFPSPPRGNFTWTLCPSNGMFYMFGGEYYDGAENLVFDDLLRWDPDAKGSQSDDDDDDDDDKVEDTNAKYNTGQWTRILTPLPHPPPRCAHSAVYHNDGIYVFGGECATAEKYHHYRDLWRLDVKKNIWEECRSRGGNPPTARSGHRAVTWRHYMIVFGGFHEALRTETRWFNDIHIYDFQTSNWTELQYGKLARLPPARSACNLALCTAPTETLYVYGGYSKLKNPNLGGGSMVGGNKSEGIMHVDCWTLPLKALLNSSKGAGGISGTSPPAWERITRKGEYPSARAGTSAIIYKNKLLVFGGVLDSEGDHHRMESVFYDDLFALDMERKRWFAMRLKKASGGGGRRRKKKKDDEENDGESDNDDEVDDEESGEAKNVEAVSSGWDVEKLKHDMFAFIDGDGNIVYERIEDESGDENDKKSERNEETENKVPGGEPVDSSVSTKDLDSSSHGGDSANQCRKEEKQNDSSNTKTSGKIAASSVMKVNAMGLPMAAARKTPLPRINCATVIRGNTLYIYGGVLEVGDREVTLDDCWSIDLVKRDKWSCIWPGQMHRQVWKGVDSDNESYISTDRGGDDDSDDEEDDEYMSEFAPMEENDEKDDDDSEKARRKAKKAAKKEKEKEKRRGIRHEMQELKDKLGIDNDQRTPLMGESVADFYARTTEYWNMEAAKTVGQVAADSGDSMSAKELKREGFQLAKCRYDELKPVLDRLNELEAMQHEAEEEKKAKKSSKGEKERKKDRR